MQYVNDLLAVAFAELVDELRQNVKSGIPKSHYFAPYSFMKLVEKLNALFAADQAGDSKDFIIFVLERIHKELQKSLQSQNINDQLTPLNQYYKNNAFQHFLSEFKKETSAISDNFFGFNETANVCQYCKCYYNSKGKSEPICYNYGIFNALVFPLEEIRKFKYNQGLQAFSTDSTPVVSLKDCFDYNRKTELFTGENKNYCNICK